MEIFIFNTRRSERHRFTIVSIIFFLNHTYKLLKNIYFYLCSNTKINPPYILAISAGHNLASGNPGQVYSPQIYKRTGPVLLL